MALQDLLNQRNQILSQRDATRSQFEQASTPVANDDAARYLQQMAGNFQPMMEERRNLMSQSTQALPSQIQQYVEQQNAGMQGPSALTALNSIFRNQSNVRQQANLIGDQIEMGRGRLGDIANSALQQLGQKQNSLRFMLGQYDNDLGRQDNMIETERARQEAERLRAAAAAQARALASYGMGGGSSASSAGASLSGGGFSLIPDEQQQKLGGVVGLAQNVAGRIQNSPTLTKFMQNAPMGDLMPAINMINNGKPLTQDLKEAASNWWNKIKKK